MTLELSKHLLTIFGNSSLFGFSKIDKRLAERKNCRCALVTLLPYPDLDYNYNPKEYFIMLGELRKKHAEKMSQVKAFLDANSIKYKTPPASAKDDGSHLAEFSYKWAAIHAGLGFIGKNDVFVHYKYAQKVRISCLLIDFDMPVFDGEIISKCGDCDLCVQACPYQYISGGTWHIDIHRDELIDYKKCASKTKYSGDGQYYACGYCVMACKYSTPSPPSK